MIAHLNVVATTVFVALFLLVTVMGFMASRWRAGDLTQLNEWGLGGRQFGSWITWFLLGGDLYTAYTVIAVPSLVYAVGAYGFFAVPYTVMIYPLVFLLMPRLWNVSARKGYVTAADFVLGRFGNPALELAVAVTGILATMPYIALQLVGMEKVIKALGFEGTGLVEHVPLSVAFIILALYTYKSGLRAPAVIAFVKDAMIYIFVIAAVTIIPYKLGGFGAVFEAAGKAYEARPNAGLLLKPGQFWPFVTTCIGSALALFMYPHALTGVLSASSARSVRVNAIALPAYSLVLGLLALMGIMAHAAGIKLDNAHAQDVVPQLMLKMFPDWFAGFTFAAIAIGALVSAAIMSIGAANTFTRNVWRPFVDPDMSNETESTIAKLVSLIVKVGALAFIIFIPTQFALDFQLLGGLAMIQIFPAIAFGLFTRRIHGWPLLIGWAVGMTLGVFLAWGPKAWSPSWLTPLGFATNIGLFSFLVNTAVAVVLSFILPNDSPDDTLSTDYDNDDTLTTKVAHMPEPVL